MQEAGRVVVVAAAGSGIGRVTARNSPAQSDTVIAVDLDRASVTETVRQIDDDGHRGQSFVAYVSDKPGVTRFVVEAALAHGRISVLVNNATGELRPVA